MEWAYGVVTVPKRINDLLPKTIRSLEGAGFNNPYLFVDGCDDPSPYTQFDLITTYHYPALKPFMKWWVSLLELYCRHPNHDYYAMFQDDILMCSNTRQYIEANPIPERGYANLYTTRENYRLAEQRGAANDGGWYLSNQKGKGALALIFPQEAMLGMMRSEYFTLRPKDQYRGWKSIDGGVVESMKKMQWREYVHNPSLVQHTGMSSTIDRSRRATGDKESFPDYRWDATKGGTSPCFKGEGFDATTLLV